MPQIENSDDLRFIANHPFFLFSGVRKKGAELPVTEGWHLRANFKNVILP